MARRPGRWEIGATLALGIVVAAVLVSRFSDPVWVAGLLGQPVPPSFGEARPGQQPAPGEPEPEVRPIPPDGFSVVAMWVEDGRPQVRHFVLQADQVRARIAQGGLGPMLEELPDAPLAAQRYGAYRTGDGAPVTPQTQEAALAGGNRCLLVLTDQVVRTLGGPEAAVRAVRRRLPPALRCQSQEEATDDRPIAPQ